MYLARTAHRDRRDYDPSKPCSPVDWDRPPPKPLCSRSSPPSERLPANLRVEGANTHWVGFESGNTHTELPGGLPLFPLASRGEMRILRSLRSFPSIARAAAYKRSRVLGSRAAPGSAAQASALASDRYSEESAWAASGGRLAAAAALACLAGWNEASVCDGEKIVWVDAHGKKASDSGSSWALAGVR